MKMAIPTDGEELMYTERMRDLSGTVQQEKS